MQRQTFLHLCALCNVQNLFRAIILSFKIGIIFSLMCLWILCLLWKSENEESKQSLTNSEYSSGIPVSTNATNFTPRDKWKNVLRTKDPSFEDIFEKDKEEREAKQAIKHQSPSPSSRKQKALFNHVPLKEESRKKIDRTLIVALWGRIKRGWSITIYTKQEGCKKKNIIKSCSNSNEKTSTVFRKASVAQNQRRNKIKIIKFYPKNESPSRLTRFFPPIKYAYLITVWNFWYSIATDNLIHFFNLLKVFISIVVASRPQNH